MSTPTWRWSACAAADAVSAGAISAVELARDALRRLEAVNPRLNAVVTMDADKTLRQAAAVDARVARGERLPLAGVPVTIKDNLWGRAGALRKARNSSPTSSRRRTRGRSRA